MACPDDNALWALAVGELSDDARDAAEAHVDVCHDCRGAVAALARLQAPGRRGPAAPRTRGAALGRYVIVDAVGAGGMGVVYSAFDPELDRKVALKLVRTTGVADRASLRERLAREARLLARISHPNVVAVYDVGVAGTEVFLAMEFIAGPTLAAWQAQPGRAWQAILDLYLQAARGLARAHEVDVVHRDFKPSNALLGPDGRVRVVDFGLARIDPAADAPPAAHDPRSALPSHDLSFAPSQPVSHDLSFAPSLPVPHDLSLTPSSPPAPAVTALTRPGLVLGTPAYMAPEQRAGRAADARSDQYSLCVALHEALFGELPDATGDLLEPAPGDPRKVPRWLRRALHRGLQRDPAARWPDMHALVAACERGRRSGPGRIALIGLASLGLALALGLAMRPPAPPPAPLCQGAASQLAGVWDPGRRAAIATRFADVGPRHAATWRTAAAALDTDAAAWVDAHTQVCAATRIYGHQSEAELVRRMRCLDDRRAELRLTVDLLARGGPDVLERAVPIVHGLTDPAACITRSGEDPTDRDDPTVRHVRDRLAEAAALVRAARHADARAILGDALVVAQARGWHTLVADGQTSLGEALEMLGEPVAAEAALYRAVWAATAARDDLRDARAWLRVAPLVAEKLARPDDAERALDHARAALGRVGPDPALTATLHTSEAAVAIARGDYARARDTLAAALATSPYPADDPRNLGLLGSHASAQHELGEHAEAAAEYRRAIALAEASLGPAHLEVGFLHDRLGNTLNVLEDLDGAEHHHQRALQIFRDSLGPWHPRTAAAIGNLANVALDRDQPAQALPRYLEVLAILSALPWPHRDAAIASYNVGQCLIGMDQPAAALPHFERAVEVQRRNNPGHPDLGYFLTGVGIAQLERGAPAAALAPLEAAVAHLQATPADPLRLAQARFELARALWPSRGDRPRAELLARLARKVFSEHAGGAGFIVDIDAWIAGRSA